MHWAQSCTYAAVIGAACLGFCGSGRANDSIAETAVGGLTLLKTDAISMDSEDLYISRDRVEVKYRFTNTTDVPVDALVAFPLPRIPAGNEGGEDEAVYWGDPQVDLQFETRVDGEKLPLQVVEQAFLGGRDVTARLSALGVPLNRLSKRFDAAVAALPKPEREKLLADKLIVEIAPGSWSGLWELQTTVTRRQTFPARKTISVEHRYKPLAGGAVGASPDSGAGYLFADSEDYHYKSKYCIDQDWRSSFERVLKKQRKNSNASEIFIGYVLTTGANWKGPIKDFRLVVDKGKPDSLVSFCADGVKKVSPTRFEVRHADFTPTKDIHILIVDWPE